MEEPTPRGRSWRHGLQGRLVILSGAGLIASYFVAGVVSEVALARANRRVVEERRLAAAALAAHLDARLADGLAALQQVALEPRVDLAGGDRTAIRAALQVAYRRIGWVTTVFVADRGGRVQVAEPVAPPEGATAALAAEVVVALHALRPTVSDVLSVAPGRGIVLLLVPYGPPRAPPSGVVGAIAESQDRAFGRLVAPLRRARPGGVQVLDGRGVVLAADLKQPLDAGETADSVLAAGAWRVRVAPVGASPAGPARRTVAWLAATVLAGTLLLAWGAARSVQSPVAALTHAAERIADGEMEVVLPPTSDDEVGRLSATFDRMRGALKDSLQAIAAANRTLEQRVEARTTELSRLYAELQIRERQRAALLAKVIGAQEQERKRVAREIHDDSCQLLVALDLRLSAALAEAPAGAPRQALAAARALTAQAEAALRRLMSDLRPAVLDDIGLVPAIRWCADRHLAAAGVKVRLELPAELPRLSHEIETALFRAVQEVIVNIERHARADRALVQVRRDPDGPVVIEIEDDGEGFDPSSLTPSPEGRGLGLLGLRERIDLVGGVAEIESARGAGTRVVLRVPIPAGAKEGSCPASGW